MVPVLVFTHEFIFDKHTIRCMYCNAKQCCIADMVKHLYKRHRSPFLCCNNCTIAVSNTDRALSRHTKLHSFTCEPCGIQCANNHAAQLHLQDHFDRDTLAMRELGLPEPTKPPPASPPPSATSSSTTGSGGPCIFCTNEIGTALDFTPCCNVPLHLECAFMWATQDLHANQTERCMHCRKPNIMLHRLQAKFTDFNWPAPWLCKQAAEEMDSATLDMINNMYGNDIIITGEFRRVASTTLPASTLTNDRYRRNVRSRREENLQRVVTGLLTHRESAWHACSLQLPPDVPSTAGN